MFEMLDKEIMELDEHEIARMEVVKANGYEAYDKEDYLKCFTKEESSELKSVEALKIKPYEIYINRNKRFIKCLEHRHDYIELQYIYSGCIRNIINNKIIELRKGEILLLDTNTAHALEPADKDDVAVNILMHKEFFDLCLMELLSQGNIISKFIVDAIYTKKNKKDYLIFNCSDNKKMQLKIKLLLDEWRNKQNNYNMSIQGLLLAIFTDLIRMYPSNMDENENLKFQKNIIEELRIYLNENYKTADLKSTAAHFNFNPDYLSRMIKQQIGVSFISILQDVKLQKSCSLLRNSDLPIEEIAELIGYSNVSYFYRIFKVHFNQTPQEYRSRK